MTWEHLSNQRETKGTPHWILEEKWELVGGVPKQTEELAIEGELTRNGVDWEYEKVGEVARGKKNEIELKRVEKEEWESEKKSWEQEKVKKKKWNQM